jgi:hypothetical protein
MLSSIVLVWYLVLYSHGCNGIPHFLQNHLMSLSFFLKHTLFFSCGRFISFRQREKQENIFFSFSINSVRKVFGCSLSCYTWSFWEASRYLFLLNETSGHSLHGIVLGKKLMCQKQDDQSNTFWVLVSWLSLWWMLGLKSSLLPLSGAPKFDVKNSLWKGMALHLWLINKILMQLWGTK